MGWFDKRSWQLRGKIKDLQADLIAAEEQGKFIVEQGLFFAELDDMGEATMMVFGATDELQSGEADIIRNFFERNGFQVERVKLDRASTGLADCEIIPPEEFTRHVGKALKAEGWRLVDDSEDERQANLKDRVYPLSSLIRSIAILFAEQVRSVTARSNIKMNKEGNRLLHWMPKIAEAIGRKCPSLTVDVVRPYFDDAYAVFYGHVVSKREGSLSGGLFSDASKIKGLQFGAGNNQPQLPIPPSLQQAQVPAQAQQPTPPSSPAIPMAPPPIPQLGAPTFRPTLPPRPDSSPVAIPPIGTPAPLSSIPPIANSPGSGASGATGSRPAPLAPLSPPPAEPSLQDKLDGSETLALVYKSLIGSSPSRCVRNCEAILDIVNRAFQASATCILKKVPGTANLSIHAQAGQKLTWGEGAQGVGFPISSSTISECLRTRNLISREQAEGGDPNASMVLHSITSSAAVPIVTGTEVLGVLYLDRRGGVRPFTEGEKENLIRIAKVFGEFTEPTLGHM
jgi:hypothetical protein